MKHISLKVPEVIRRNFRFSTLDFLFIILYVNVFQFIFGPENSIVGVIFTIMMSASMARDLTATPFRHLVIQAFILIWMALASYWVVLLPAPISFTINFVTLLIILYVFTYEYSSHLYFPYILSYLFLVFISPINAQQVPKRLAAMLAGALSIMLYQWFMGRNKVVETARDVLTEMIDEVCKACTYAAGETSEKGDRGIMRRKLCRLGHTVYDRRKKALCISDASFSMIAAGRGLEHLLILIKELSETLSEQEKSSLLYISGQLKIYRGFLSQETDSLPPVDTTMFAGIEEGKAALRLYHAVFYIRDRLLHMTDPENKGRYKKTALSLKTRLETALDFSPVRAIYAVRTALLLSLGTVLVQAMALPHGLRLAALCRRRASENKETCVGYHCRRIGLCTHLLFHSLAGRPHCSHDDLWIHILLFYRLCTDLCLFHRRGDRRGSIYACLRAAGCGQHVPDQDRVYFDRGFHRISGQLSDISL